MQSRWDDREASRYRGPLALRAYSSRLLGKDRSLVLHGGGNTSVKINEKNAAGQATRTLYVKGSGADLAHASENDFTPLELAKVQALINQPGMDNAQMMKEVGRFVTSQAAPKPSIETLLHAVLPFDYVEHTHADAVLAITNTANGLELAQQVFGDCAIVVPYHHSGFALAQACYCAYRAHARPDVIGMVLIHHGVFAWGQSAKESYQNMIALAARAEDYLKSKNAWELPRDDSGCAADTVVLARLRREISLAAGYPLLLTHRGGPIELHFARRSDLSQISQQGPATPQHAIFTKRVPLLGRDVAGFAENYRRYLGSAGEGAAEKLDPAPRVVLDGELGLCAAGINAYYAIATAEVYRHDIEIISRASAHGSYVALDPALILEAECLYGGFESKMRERAAGMVGETALVSGAASPFGKLLVAALLEQGAAVVALDPDPAVATICRRPDYLGIPCEFASGAEITQALARGVRAFGGIDALAIADSTGRALIERALPYLELSPFSARAVVAVADGAAVTSEPGVAGLPVRQLRYAAADMEQMRSCASIAAKMCSRNADFA